MKIRYWPSRSRDHIFLVDLYSANGSMKFKVPHGAAHHYNHTTILAIKDFGV